MLMFKNTSLAGCFEIHPEVFEDIRGRFIKFFQGTAFSQKGLDTRFVEEYYSESHQGVIRGLHFQAPPYEHKKLVTCLIGSVLDVTVDLRKNSPSYLKVHAVEMSGFQPTALYIPPGIAHGFCVLSEFALMLYKTSVEYRPEHDAGLLWSSIPFDWPVQAPIVSRRDSEFVKLIDFQTPFF